MKIVDQSQELRYKKIKMTRFKKRIAITLLLIMGLDMITPHLVLATTGPTTPEIQSFTQAGDSELVNLFTGDFSYNIPLFELPGPNGGYPINLSYQSGITLEQEASWVGLGWSLNASGAVARAMRGLPDDFKGDIVKTHVKMKPKRRVGVTGGANLEIFGKSLPDGEKSPFTAGVSLSIYNDSYTGIGYSLGTNVGFSEALNSNSGVSLGLGLSLDSDQGVTIRPSAGLISNYAEGNRQFNSSIGAGYNSKEGLTNISLSSGLGFVQHAFGMHGYTPTVNIPMKNTSKSAKFKAGGQFWGVFGNAHVTAFETQQIVHPDIANGFDTPGYGYLYHQDANTESMMDVNREKEGMISPQIPNLPIPIQTYDMYNVSGHGISKTYRPYRADIGVLYDSETTSKISSGALGVDAAPAFSKVGVNLTVKGGGAQSGKWVDNNYIARNFGFTDFNKGDNHEPWYFKATSDMAATAARHLNTYDGDNPVTVAIGGNKSDVLAGSIGNHSYPYKMRERNARSSIITPLTNKEILGIDPGTGGEMAALPYFKLDHIIDFNRLSLPKHHIGGFIAVNEEGVRYIYALPVYNTETIDYSFSTNAEIDNNGSVLEESNLKNSVFYKKTELPRYAYTYMLTAILGPDYIDVGQNGIDAEDHGYWVKFDYKKEADDRTWKTPYKGAVYSEGLLVDNQDDRASFSIGSKEIYYLSRAETKSHIAEFIVGNRADGVEASRTSARGTVKSKRLDRIELYARQANGLKGDEAIKKVKFNYNYCLCQNELSNDQSASICDDTDDNLNLGNGKLTLVSLSVINGKSSRGEASPYRFKYASNPIYSQYAQDHWGYYTDQYQEKLANRRHFPYTHQENAKDLHEPVVPGLPGISRGDYNASAWSLTKIKLPEGAEIEITYEADDYAYVQHKPAMQLVEIKNSNVDLNGNWVSFNLPPETTMTSQEVAEKYLGDEKYLYFKVLMQMKTSYIIDYVSGYAEIAKDLGEHKGVTVNQTTKTATIYLKSETNKNLHPIKVRTLDQIRNSSSFLLTSNSQHTPGLSLKALQKLFTTVGEIRTIFKGYYTHTKDIFGLAIEDDSDESDNNVKKSYIRLRVPTRKKIGGGVRVKRLVFRENFNGDEKVVYGKTYDYTLEDGTSSGVAAFEPSIGKEENPLRQPKFYSDSAPLRADKRFFFEYPINESYYPSPQVGYSMVTVRSLASAAREGDLFGDTQIDNYFPDVSYGTTGKQVSEFYTARDYPVFTAETNKARTQIEKKIVIPLVLFSNVENHFSATQGYSVIVNDMHGKPKRTEQFRQGTNGLMDLEPYAWTNYTYFDNDDYLDRVQVRKLSNVFYEDTADPFKLRREQGGEPYGIGVTRELFVDMRENKSEYIEGGAQGNLDFVNIPVIFGFIPVPVPTAWPNLGLEKERVRIGVVNKIISYNGVLKEVQSFTEGATVKNEFKAWDKLTGRAILSRTEDMYNTNKYVYTENLPAYHQTGYSGMGPAYQNIGMEFTIVKIKDIPGVDHEYSIRLKSGGGFLTSGDELVLSYIDDSDDNKLKKVNVTYLGVKHNGVPTIYSGTSLDDRIYDAVLYRSGHRNHLNVDAGSYNYLAD